MGINTNNDLAQERYQDLIEYFGDEKVAKIILGNRGQFKAWLERLRWHVKRANELARELEQLKGTTNNDLGVDCISRADAIRVASGYCHPSNVAKELAKLPSVTPQEPVIDKIKNDMADIGEELRTRFDKIRAQIKSNLRGVEIALEVLDENHPLRPKMEGAKDTLEDCLELIDKAETEEIDGTNK